MSTIEITVPDIGDFKDVEIIEVLVKVGDSIKAEQSLVTVESDKASMEIPSAASGTLKELKVKLGDRVNQGSPLGVLESEQRAAAAPVAAKPAPSAVPAAAEASEAAGAGDALPADAAPVLGPAPAKPAAAAPAAAAQIEIKVPDIGDFDAVEVIEVLVKAGDTVQIDQSLITVESDKASMEIPSAAAGVVREVRVKVGDKVSEGSVVAILEATAGAAAATAAPAAQAPPVAPAPAVAPAAPAPKAAIPAEPEPQSAPKARAHPVPEEDHPAPGSPLPHASPSIRKLARELGVDLTRVSGSGAKGRIVQQDVQDFVKQIMAASLAGRAGAPSAREGFSALELLPWPGLDFSKFGATETLALSRIKKISGPNLARNWAMIPHVTQFDEADVTELETFRKSTNEALAKQGIKVTMLALVMKACVAALKQFPTFNSSLDASGANLILKKYYHLGFAADTPNGLVVPVLRDCDAKGIGAIAAQTTELAGKAREGKLAPADMQGASFTISSLGGVGGTAFTPIINAPEVAILGLSKSEIKPRWDGQQFVPRLMLPLSLSYDHRVVDGAQAARFTGYLAELLADLRRVLL